MAGVARACSKCGGVLDERADHGRCRECVNAYQRRWRASKPNHRISVAKYKQSPKGKLAAKRRHLREKYGLDVQEHEEMVKAQEGRCAICTREFTEKLVPCVDHNHETGAIRGILCRACNGSIGGLRDDVAMVIRAVAYLQRSERGVLIHPLALIGSAPESREFYADPDAKAFFPDIGEGARINAFVTIDSGTQRRTTVGPRSLAMVHSHVGHDAVLGADVELAPGVVVGGWAELGDGVRVGMNATIRNRVKIGAGARIGMGAVVTKDVPAGETWIGSPARNIKTDPRLDPLWDEWWESRGTPRG